MSAANDLFEGKGYEDDFKPLTPKYYPPRYQRYIAEEAALLRKKLAGAGRALEAGVGIGRLIPELAPLVGSFVGVDNAEFMLRTSLRIAAPFPNVEIRKANLEELPALYPRASFDYSLLLWNTLGNVADEREVVAALAAITGKEIIVTVHLKGASADRAAWYEAVGIPIASVDASTETFTTASGLRSKAYSLEDMESVARDCGLRIVESKELAGVVLWAVMA